MKQLLLFVSLFFIAQTLIAQIDGPKDVTPQVLQKIKADIEKEVPAFKQKLTKQTLTADQIEFATDTFRIEQILAYRIDIDFSTVGMNISMDERTAAYDKLLNKYYNKLMQLLQPEDKKILVSAQKAWLAYRDAEYKLIWGMIKDEYSGGGTMYTSIATSAYADLVVTRAVAIFNYYDGIIKSKQ